MFNIVSQNGKNRYTITEYICDTREDINALPTDDAAGSKALVAEDSSTWVLNTQKQWCELEKTGGGGGGGTGTSDYNQLTNKPKINNVILKGNKTLDELGIQPKGDYITAEVDPTVPSWAKNPTKPAYTAKEVGALPEDTVIPSKTSELTNDSGFLTEHQSLEGYATENYVDTAVSGIKVPTSLSELAQDSEHRTVTDAEKEKWNSDTGKPGTTDYIDLTNKPQINNIELSGNKTLEELGIQAKGDYISVESDPTVPQYVKNITEENISTWNNKSDFSGSYNDLIDKPTIPDATKVKGQAEEVYRTGEVNLTQENLGIWTGTKVEYLQALSKGEIKEDSVVNITDDFEEGGGGTGGTTDYIDLTNKPQINSIELSGNKTLEELGIQAKGSYLTEELDPTVPAYVKNITESDISNWNDKSTFDGNYESLTNKPAIPSKTSDLNNDSNFVVDSAYVHTDNNFTTEEKTKLTELKNTSIKGQNEDTYRSGNVNLTQNDLGIWTGTKAEYNIAIENKKIKVGTIVNITDDSNDSGGGVVPPTPPQEIEWDLNKKKTWLNKNFVNLSAELFEIIPNNEFSYGEFQKSCNGTIETQGLIYDEWLDKNFKGFGNQIQISNEFMDELNKYITTFVNAHKSHPWKDLTLYSINTHPSADKYATPEQLKAVKNKVKEFFDSKNYNGVQLFIKDSKTIKITPIFFNGLVQYIGDHTSYIYNNWQKPKADRHYEISDTGSVTEFVIDSSFGGTFLYGDNNVWLLVPNTGIYRQFNTLDDLKRYSVGERPYFTGEGFGNYDASQDNSTTLAISDVHNGDVYSDFVKIISENDANALSETEIELKVNDFLFNSVKLFLNRSIKEDNITINFLDNGDIEKRYSNGNILYTEFLEDNIIKESLYNSSNEILQIKTTTFQDDGSITINTISN